MSQRSVVSAMLLLSALGLLGWWFVGRLKPSVRVGPGVPTLEPAQARPAKASPLPGAPVAYTDQTGFVPPDLASATPAEIRAIHDAEVRNSAAAQPPQTYKGMDGKAKAFKYNDARAQAEEVVNDRRRQQLMHELKQDPKAFALRYGLSAKEVQWMLDGDTDFPDRILAH